MHLLETLEFVEVIKPLLDSFLSNARSIQVELFCSRDGDIIDILRETVSSISHSPNVIVISGNPGSEMLLL